MRLLWKFNQAGAGWGWQGNEEKLFPPASGSVPARRSWPPVVEFPGMIRLFIKPYCPWCHKAVAWLNAQGVQYETLDVISDSKAMTEMVNLSGQRFAPVMDVDGEILANFGPDELAEFWKKISAAK